MNVDIAIHYRRALEIARDSLTGLPRDLLVTMCVAPENEMAAGLLAPLLGLEHHGRLNFAIAGLAKKLARAVDVKPPTRKAGSSRWWQIAATGREAPHGRFFWKLRPALHDAAMACDLVPTERALFPEVVDTDLTLLASFTCTTWYPSRSRVGWTMSSILFAIFVQSARTAMLFCTVHDRGSTDTRRSQPGPPNDQAF